MSWFGLLGIAVFVVALLVLHAAALRNLPAHMSQFGNSRFGLFWLLAIYSFIFGTGVLVWALRPCLRDCMSKRIGMALLFVAGFGALLLATFPADETFPTTIRGTIHDDAALTTFVMLGAAMLVLAPAFRSTPSLVHFAGVSLVLGLLVNVAWIVYLATTLQDMAIRGPIQRVLVGLIVAWFTLLALRLRNVGPVTPLRKSSSEPLVSSIRRKSSIAPATLRGHASR